MDRDEEGFTLIELLVSMLAGALLVAILASMLSDIRRSWQRDPGRLDEALRLSERLDALVGGALVADPQSGETSFTGRHDGFTALVPAPAATSRLGLIELTVEARHGVVGEELVASIAPSRAGNAGYPAEVFAPQVLASSAQPIQFSYYRAGTVASAPSWPASGTLPSMIGIKLGAANSPPILIRTVANTDGRCLFDAISLACRLPASPPAQR